MIPLTDVFEHRRADYTLDAQQEDRDRQLRSFLAGRTSTTSLRGLGPVSHDAAMLAELVDAGHLPAPDHALSWGVTDLAVAMEALGSAMAPVPAVECLVAARLLQRIVQIGDVDLGSVPELDARTRATLALRPLHARQLVPGGAVSQTVLGIHETGLLALPGDLPQAANRAGAPLGWLEPGGELPPALVPGPVGRELFDLALAEWRVLTSALCVGLAQTALSYGVEFARTRTTHNTPIGALQGISHPLAAAHVSIASARDLVRKAAWYLQFEPESRPEFVLMALVAADECVNLATRVSVHVQGGYGVSLESDVTLTVMRAKTWLRPAGRTDDWLVEIGRLVVQRSHGAPAPAWHREEGNG